MRIVLYTGILSLGLFFAGCKSKKDATAKAVPVETAGTLSAAPVPSDDLEGINLGNKAPDILMKNPKDSVIKLSSLKGKIVLIDFWASWCGPCRRENPVIVGVYQRFKDQQMKNAKGFAVYSVSLDHTKARWEEAIMQDKLEWPYHVSDLQGWNNVAAAKFAVQGIPTNYLIDANGIIIAKGLRGEELVKTLENLAVK